MDHPTPTSAKVASGQCSNLRHKMMYVMPEPDPGESRFFDAYDATAYWCIRTQSNIGPDWRPVHRDVCKSGRGCCS